LRREVHRSALVPHPPAVMYALVNDVAAYPEFLPWCRASRVLDSSPTHMRASLELARGGLARWFTTANVLVPDRSIAIALEHGPFKALGGTWTFEPIGSGCKVSLDMAFEFDGMLLDLTLGPALSDIFGSLLDAFVARAAAQQP
jgi:ribosome-associated toxin RatA of RatAB toxin-antitoxin module